MAKFQQQLRKFVNYKNKYFIYILFSFFIAAVFFWQYKDMKNSRHHSHSHSHSHKDSDKKISNLTDHWCKEVSEKNDPAAIARLFCPDGNLVGTVSQIKRTGAEIQAYFDYFAKLPNITILHKKYNISKVSRDVYINTAFITWTWAGLKKPLTARMSFVFKHHCIFQLHSSALPEVNTQLLNISNLI